MATLSFAEILQEKINKSQRKTLNSHNSEDISPINSIQTEDSELTRLRIQLLELRPNVYSISQAKLNATPYFQFRAMPTKEWAKKGHPPQNKAKESPKPAPRPKGIAHKLTELQTKAMTYFIQEQMFLLEDFTSDELKKAYRKLALKKHPDRQQGSTHQFLELKKNYETLYKVFKK